MIHKLTAIKVLKAVSYTLILSSFVKTFIGNMITFVVTITQLMSLCFYYTFERKISNTDRCKTLLLTCFALTYAAQKYEIPEVQKCQVITLL